MNPRFPLGEPPFDDVDGAAALLLRYEREGQTSREFYGMFALMVEDIGAVLRRAQELRASSAA